MRRNLFDLGLLRSNQETSVAKDRITVGGLGLCQGRGDWSALDEPHG